MSSLLESVCQFLEAHAALCGLIDSLRQEREIPKDWDRSAELLAALERYKEQVYVFLLRHGHCGAVASYQYLSRLLEVCHGAVQAIDGRPWATIDLDALHQDVYQAGEPFRLALHVYRAELESLQQSQSEEKQSGERVRFDDATQTVTLDEKPIHVDNNKAYAIYKFIYTQYRPGCPVKNAVIQRNIRGINGHNAVSKCLKLLPNALRQTVKGSTAGKRIELGPLKK